MEAFDKLPSAERKRITDLSEEFVKFPLSIATPVYFGDMSKHASDAKLGNGTGTLVALGDRRFCITNHHVLHAYRQRVATNPSVRFQIGNVQVDPETILVSESSHFDLVVLDASAWPAQEIASDGPVPTRFMEAYEWPPRLPKKGQFVMFGGYPGYWRESTGPQNVRFDTLSSGATEVHDARDDNIVCQLQLERCLTHSFVPGRDNPGELTGLSGGPVLMERQSAGGISVFELIGIIYEYSSSIDALYIRPLSLISSEGVVCRRPVGA